MLFGLCFISVAQYKKVRLTAKFVVVLNLMGVKLWYLEREIVRILTDMLTHTATAEACHSLYWRL